MARPKTDQEITNGLAASPYHEYGCGGSIMLCYAQRVWDDGNATGFGKGWDAAIKHATMNGLTLKSVSEIEDVGYKRGFAEGQTKSVHVIHPAADELERKRTQQLINQLYHEIARLEKIEHLAGLLARIASSEIDDIVDLGVATPDTTHVQGMLDQFADEHFDNDGE